MGFEQVRSDRGQPRVKCSCDECARVEVVAAVHGKKGGDGHGQAVTKLQKQGWTYLGKTLRCPSCEAKRKAGKAMEVKSKTKGAPVHPAPPREPTRAQKREIMDLLDDVYDVEAERYRRGDTDDTVADVLGVMPGWVAQLREDFFGPAGGNEEMAALIGVVDDLAARVDRCLADLRAKEVSPLVDFKTEIDAVRRRLGAIEKAVGPRVMAGAKASASSRK